MKRIVALSLVLLIVLSAVACGEKDTNSKNPENEYNSLHCTEQDTEPIFDVSDTNEICTKTVSQTAEVDIDGKTIKLMLNNGVKNITYEFGTVALDLKDYKVVRAENAEKGVKDAFVTFRSDIKENTGLNLPGGTDWVGGEFKEVDKEILIGLTNREESVDAAKGLKYGDYSISCVGTKIVIAGGSAAAVTAAVKLFTTCLLDVKAKTALLPETPFLFEKYYPFDSLTVDGVPIGNFSVYNETSNQTEKILAALIDKMTGDSLPEANLKNGIEAGKHYLIVSDAGTYAKKFSVTVENGNLCVTGSYNTYSQAIQYFTETMLPALANKNRNYNITSADNYIGDTGTKTIYSKDKLLSVLSDVYKSDNVIIGQQCNDGQGLPNTTITDFESYSGEKPGILGIDLACYGIQLMEISKSKRSQIICELTEYASEGGIITASSHFENPTGNWTSGGKCRGTLGSIDNWDALLTEGTDLNKRFKDELTVDAEFLRALGNNGVPVLWRPLHESNGGWFWFCTIMNGVTLDSSYLKRLWQYIYDYYVNDLKLTNLIWVYAPNVSNSNNSPMPVMYCYPGDEYVDMIGVDWYSGGGYEIDGSGKSYSTLLKQTGKIGAITEFGTGSSLEGATAEQQAAIFSCTDLYDILVRMNRSGMHTTYLLTWTGGDTIGYFGYADLFMREDITLGLSDVKRLLYS